MESYRNLLSHLLFQHEIDKSGRETKRAENGERKLEFSAGKARTKGLEAAYNSRHDG